MRIIPGWTRHLREICFTVQISSCRTLSGCGFLVRQFPLSDLVALRRGKLNPNRALRIGRLYVILGKRSLG